MNAANPSRWLGGGTEVASSVAQVTKAARHRFQAGARLQGAQRGQSHRTEVRGDG